MRTMEGSVGKKQETRSKDDDSEEDIDSRTIKILLTQMHACEEVG